MPKYNDPRRTCVYSKEFKHSAVKLTLDPNKVKDIAYRFEHCHDTRGIDYIEGQQHGNLDIQLEKIEFVGEWISAENWYLLILGSWMFGIFFYANMRLVQLHQQTKQAKAQGRNCCVMAEDKLLL